MADDDFAKLTIDQDPTEEVWTEDVPYLDYWSFRYNRQVLGQKQAAFYKYFKDCVRAGRGVDLRGHYAYVSLLKDELIKMFNSRRLYDRTEIVMMALSLKKMYGYSGDDLSKIIDTDRDVKRARRLNNNLKTPEAVWIEPETSVDVDGVTYVRGGFYLGSHLKFNKYDLRKGDFQKKSTPVEGPVVNLNSRDFCPESWRYTNYSTFVEMPDHLRDKYLEWLKGGDDFDSEMLMYYLAGWEFRLFCDVNTSELDRFDLVKRMVDFYHDFTVWRKYRDVEVRLLKMIDLAIALFFDGEIDHVWPDADLSYLNLVQVVRISQGFKGMSLKNMSDSEIARSLFDYIPIPSGLPEYYVDAYKEQLRQSLQMTLRYRAFSYLYDDSFFIYTPISNTNKYLPTGILSAGIRFNMDIFQSKEKAVLGTAINTAADMLRQIKSFLRLKSIGASVISMINALPSWLNPDLIPGAKDAVKAISPEDGQKFKIMRVADLVNFVEGTNIDAVSMVVEYPEGLIAKLEKFGLNIGYFLSGNIGLRYDDYVAIYHDNYTAAPTRGTLMISLYLVTWMVTADAVRQSDLDIIDRWIERFDPKANYVVPVQAIFRWLMHRKITMTAKRKKKSATLAKSVKRRQEFMAMLLEIMSDPSVASPKRMKRLTVIYELMGLDPANIHSDIHRLAMGGGAKTKPKTAASAKTPGSGRLDKGRLKEIEASTLKAQEILADVFSTDEEKPAAPTNPVSGINSVNPLNSLLAKLLVKSEWSRSEFESLCKEYSMTAGSALEALNDLSYDTVDEAVAEDDGEIIYIDTDVAKLVNKHE